MLCQNSQFTAVQIKASIHYISLSHSCYGLHSEYTVNAQWMHSEYYVICTMCYAFCIFHFSLCTMDSGLCSMHYLWSLNSFMFSSSLVLLASLMPWVELVPLTMLQLLDKLGSNVKSESDNRSDPEDGWISPWSGWLFELLTGLTRKVTDKAKQWLGLCLFNVGYELAGCGRSQYH